MSLDTLHHSSPWWGSAFTQCWRTSVCWACTHHSPPPLNLQPNGQSETYTLSSGCIASLARCLMRSIATGRVAWCVMTVSPAKMAESIEMSFGMLTQVGSRNHVLDGSPHLHMWNGRHAWLDMSDGQFTQNDGGSISTCRGNWTTRGYANSRTGHLADWSPRGLVNSQTGQVADWTTRGLADAAKRTKTKHAKSPVASTSCPVRKLAIRELAYPQVVQ